MRAREEIEKKTRGENLNASITDLLASIADVLSLGEGAADVVEDPDELEEIGYMLEDIKGKILT